MLQLQQKMKIMIMMKKIKEEMVNQQKCNTDKYLQNKNRESISLFYFIVRLSFFVIVRLFPTCGVYLPKEGVIDNPHTQG